VIRASDKYIHNYFYILYLVRGTTFCRTQNNEITWQSRAVNNFVREGIFNDSLVIDVLSPTATLVYFLTVESLYKAPTEIWQSLFLEGGHGLFAVILSALLLPGPNYSLLFQSILFWVWLWPLQ